MALLIPLEKAWRDSKGRVNFKVSCGFSNQERRWAVNVWVKAELSKGNQHVATHYALHTRIPLAAHPVAGEKEKLLTGVRELFTLKLDDLGIKYKERSE